MTTNSAVKPIVVAILDGNAQRRTEMSGALSSFYRIALFSDGQRALDDLAKSPPALFVVDEMVPPFGAPKFLSMLRRHPTLAKTLVVYISEQGGAQAAATARQAGANAFIDRPFKRSALIKTISGLSNRAVETSWEHLPERAGKTLRQTVEAFNGISDLIDHGEPLNYAAVADACAPLVSAVSDNDYRAILNGVRDHDNYSYVHSLRVATLLSLFGYTIGLKADDLLMLAAGGLVHDIGKMSIPYEVLNKPGRLDGAEWEVMKSHVPRTVSYLRDHSHVPHAVLTIAEQHHEKLNGTGYPGGLKGAELNELARMASICDVFGALTDRRCYKPPMEPEKALSIMIEEMTAELDQHLLTMFREMLLDSAVQGGKTVAKV